LILALLADGEGALAEIAAIVVLAVSALLTTTVLLIVWLGAPRENRRGWKAALYVVVAVFSALLPEGIFSRSNFLTRRL
jgi:hypothetical protein